MGEGYRSLSSSLCGFLHFPCFLIPLRLKYFSQHPILKHPQHIFLPQCERPSFTPIQINRQSYISVTLIFIFWVTNCKTKESAPNYSKHCLTSIWS
jgi:hypothetical protein